MSWIKELFNVVPPWKSAIRSIKTNQNIQDRQIEKIKELETEIKGLNIRIQELNSQLTSERCMRRNY